MNEADRETTWRYSLDTAPEYSTHILTQRNHGSGPRRAARRLAAAFRLAAYATRKGHTVTIESLGTTNSMQYLCIAKQATTEA